MNYGKWFRKIRQVKCSLGNKQSNEVSYQCRKARYRKEQRCKLIRARPESAKHERYPILNLKLFRAVTTWAADQN